jgi:hypothetical protein
MKSTIWQVFQQATLLALLCAGGVRPLHAADPNIEGEPPELVPSAKPPTVKPRSAFATEYDSWKGSVYLPVTRIQKWVADNYKSYQKKYTGKVEHDRLLLADCTQTAVEKLKGCYIFVEGFQPKDPRIVRAHQLLEELVRLDLAYDEVMHKSLRANNSTGFEARRSKYLRRRRELIGESSKGMTELEKAARQGG